MHYFKIIQILFQIIAKNSELPGAHLHTSGYSDCVYMYYTFTREDAEGCVPCPSTKARHGSSRGLKRSQIPSFRFCARTKYLRVKENSNLFSNQGPHPRKIIAKWRKYIVDIFENRAPPMAIPEILVPSNIYSGLKKSFLIRYM